MKLKALIFVMSFISLNSYAIRAGNGGGYVRCENEVVMMADMAEGMERYDLRYDHLTSMGETELINYAMRRLFLWSPKFAIEVQKKLERYRKTIKVTDAQFFDTEDYQFIVLPKGCKYYPLANWDNLSGKVFINESVYREELDMVGRVFLEMHEAIYAAFRGTAFGGHVNSDLARKVNAYALSDNKDSDGIFANSSVSSKNHIEKKVEGGILYIPDDSLTRALSLLDFESFDEHFITIKLVHRELPTIESELKFLEGVVLYASGSEKRAFNEKIKELRKRQEEINRCQLVPVGNLKPLGDHSYLYTASVIDHNLKLVVAGCFALNPDDYKLTVGGVDASDLLKGYNKGMRLIPIYERILFSPHI